MLQDMVIESRNMFTHFKLPVCGRAIRGLKWVSAIRLPAEREVQLTQLKNLSNMSAKRAVSAPLDPTVSSRAFDTDWLRTCRE